jgi:hypothetical protein
MFTELYGDTNSRDVGAWNATFDSGLLVKIGRDWQVDGGAYMGLVGAVPRATPFLGLSSRL